MFTVVGYKSMDFTARDGGQIAGCKLMLEYEDQKIVGVGTDQMFLSRQKMDDIGYVPEVGDKIEVYYNKYGKVQDIQLVK